MDKIITKTPVPDKELAELISKAGSIYKKNFDGNIWFGRCIFLSWYCDRGTCTFCFRSVQKHRIKHPEKARRSMYSILAEAMMIKGFGWRIEFLTGGYGIREDDELIRIVKLVSQILDEPIWVNLGEIGTSMLKSFKPYTQGIISSIETVNPTLHKKVCPDKPIEPFEDMMKESKPMGFKHGMTIIIGLGETRDDFKYLKIFLEKHNLDRITIYALRPVANTPFENGPDSLDVAWWIANTRIHFPKIEIIVGTAQYRIPEISLVLKAGANAITKLPASKMFNTQDGLEVEKQVKLANRNFVSRFSAKDVYKLADWDSMLNRADLSDEEKIQVKKVLDQYLSSMQKKAETLFSKK